MRPLLALALLCACASAPTDMGIKIQPTSYTAAMSSTIGIGLTPHSAPPRGTKVRYHWTASSGRFLSWSENTHEITERGPETLTLDDGGKLYWAYNAAEMAAKKPVTVTVLTEDMASGKVLARADVHLIWEEDVVRVVR
jgi:hypothetical protein